MKENRKIVFYSIASSHAQSGQEDNEVIMNNKVLQVSPEIRQALADQLLQSVFQIVHLSFYWEGKIPTKIIRLLSKFPHFNKITLYYANLIFSYLMVTTHGFHHSWKSYFLRKNSFKNLS